MDQQEPSDDDWGRATGAILPTYQFDFISSLAAALKPLADGLIEVAYDEAEGKLIGNFGDWAQSEDIPKFEAIAQQFGLEMVHQNEAGSLLELYPDSVIVELPRSPTRTQEALLREWRDYP
jgi:hypothetical protein